MNKEKKNVCYTCKGRMIGLAEYESEEKAEQFVNRKLNDIHNLEIEYITEGHYNVFNETKNFLNNFYDLN
jgi:hypothetical protein